MPVETLKGSSRRPSRDPPASRADTFLPPGTGDRFLRGAKASGLLATVEPADAGASRKDIRTVMVELLRGIHDKGRYCRIIIVAHSLGASIAYDGITALWPQMCNLQAGEPSDGSKARLPHLRDLQAAAVKVAGHDPAVPPTPAQQDEVAKFRTLHFDPWQDNRAQGNPWLITDFISVGTPMYFAGLLYTHNRADFEQLTKAAELPKCPPNNGSQPVEEDLRPPGRYGLWRHGRQTLVHSAPFAVVRWTNLYFPAVGTFFGDWFGGPLRPLFGSGILDKPVLGLSLIHI